MWLNILMAALAVVALAIVYRHFRTSAVITFYER